MIKRFIWIAFCSVVANNVYAADCETLTEDINTTYERLIEQAPKNLEENSSQLTNYCQKFIDQSCTDSKLRSMNSNIKQACVHILNTGKTDVAQN